MTFRPRLVVALSLLLTACGPTKGADDGGDPGDFAGASDAAIADALSDGAALDDAGPLDLARLADLRLSDGGAEGGSGDGGDDDGILGTLGGSCGTVRALLDDSTPALVEDALRFVAGERYARDALSPGGQRLYDTPNAGGSSTESEVMSYEVLRACEGASLLKTETEIGYAPPDDAGPSTITDLLVAIGGEKVGVSVTRAYKPARLGALTDGEVKTIVAGKLAGVVRSSMRVQPADRWVKQILHVFVASAEVARAVERVLPTIDAAVRADTIVLVTTTTGGGFIYCNPDPPLGMECPP